MTNRKAKAYATATVLGLGALGGFALSSNPGTPVVSGQASGGSGATASVVTSASGATTAVGTEATQAGTTARAPIVTRASGAGGSGQAIDD